MHTYPPLFLFIIDPNTTPNSSIDLSDLPDIPHNQYLKKNADMSKLVFQSVVKKRGRPKKSREGQQETAKKKKQKFNFIEEVESIFPKKPESSRKYIRGPYNKSNDASQQNESKNKSGYKRGPYKKKNVANISSNANISDNVDNSNSNNISRSGSNLNLGQVDDSFSSFEFEDTIKRPRRAPNTRRVMKRDFPASQQIFPATQKNPILPTVEEIPSEDCYTCGFPLNRSTQEKGERVVRCENCREVDIHESCQRACRRCEEIEEM